MMDRNHREGEKVITCAVMVLQGLDSKSVPVTPLAEKTLTKLDVEVWEKGYFTRKKFDSQRTDCCHILNPEEINYYYFQKDYYQHLASVHFNHCHSL